MTTHNLVGFRANRIIVCDLCQMKKDKGGYVLREPISGVFCSAEHARVMVERKLGGEK